MSTPKRNWSEAHMAAGYHEQEWGPVPAKNSPILGDYDCLHSGVPMTLRVSWLASGPTGPPELQITWEDGHAVTVLDEATAMEYLLRDLAKKR